MDEWLLTSKNVNCFLDLVPLGKKSQVAVNYAGLWVDALDMVGWVLQLHYDVAIS